MKTLEELVREAASKGLASLTFMPQGGGVKGFRSPTFYAEWRSERSKVYWTCRGTPSARHGYVGVEHAVDPVDALTQCLLALPGAKQREPKKKITAAVTEPSDLAGMPE